MTSEMVERVAKAMCRWRAERMGINVDQLVIPGRELQMSGKYFVVPEVLQPMPLWQLFRAEAEELISVMREPTEAMVLAAVNTHPRDLKLGASIPAARWQAMIDEALK